MKRTPLYIALAGLSLSAASTLTTAQEDAVIDELIVTGSYIPGSPEDAAAPVDVVTAEDMSKLGTPDMLEFIKNLNVSSGVLGASNQFDGRSQGADGAGSVNLRGLGQERTLVLMNGRRIANNAFTGSVDTNLLPVAAMGRVEILKDGAAVLYGSDAVGGVVNFITKKDFEGFELGYDHSFIDDSSGDDTVRAAWGWVGDSSNVLLSAGYQKRNRLSVADRDWGRLSVAENPQGGWSGGGNPSGFIPLADTSDDGQFADPGCADLGGTPLRAAYSGPDTGTVPRCYFEYTPFDNLVDPQERYQFYGEYNQSFGDIEWHLEGLYAHTETEYYTSPSYLATQRPTANETYGGIPLQFLTGNFLVPGDHPGLEDMRNQYAGTPVAVRSDGTTQAPSTDIAALLPPGAGVLMAPLTFRPYGMGGNPLFGFEAAQTTREYDQYRLSTSLNGDFGGGISWDVGLTYSEVVSYRDGSDTLVDRYQRALAGLGGPNCSGNPADAFDSDAGCLTYSPFSTSIRLNGLTGQANPNFVNAYDNENPELINWMFNIHGLEDTSTNLTLDAVFNGDLGLELAGGEVRWAGGVQYREDTYERELGEFNNLANYPCPAAVDRPDFTSCEDYIQAQQPSGATSPQADGTGPFFFLGGNNELDTDRDVYAVFGELNLPLLDTLEMQLAVRYEDYGGQTGDTFDPKVALRWQATDWLAFRGSYSSTFRAPPITDTTDRSVTSLQNINNTFRPIDAFGDPALDPESADTYNVGAIFETGGLYASVDYWQFDFDNPLTVDPLTPMVDALFGASGDENCGAAGYEGLQDRFTFSGACHIDNISRVRTDIINGSSRNTDGVDLRIEYTWDLASGNAITLGSQSTYTLSYEFDDVFVEGILVEEGRDAVGFLNAQTSAYPLPELKGDVFGEYTMGDHNFRLVSHFIDSYTDQRFDEEVDSMTTFDLHYRLFWSTESTETTFNLSLENLTDEDPSFVRLDLDYDPFTHNPIGRTVKAGFTVRF